MEVFCMLLAIGILIGYYGHQYVAHLRSRKDITDILSNRRRVLQSKRGV